MLYLEKIYFVTNNQVHVITWRLCNRPLPDLDLWRHMTPLGHYELMYETIARFVYEQQGI